MKNKQSKVLFIAQAAMVAAIYVVLTLVGASFSYGEVQVRISEALTILPVFTPRCNSRINYRLSYQQHTGRMHPSGYHLRKPGNPDRRDLYLDAPQQEQVSCSAAAHHRKCDRSALRTQIRISGAAADPVHDADSWNRGSDFLRRAGTDTSHSAEQI